MRFLSGEGGPVRLFCNELLSGRRFCKKGTNETKETTEHLVEALDSLMGCDLENTCANQ
jgi:hypothetical protein